MVNLKSERYDLLGKDIQVLRARLHGKNVVFTRGDGRCPEETFWVIVKVKMVVWQWTTIDLSLISIVIMSRISCPVIYLSSPTHAPSERSIVLDEYAVACTFSRCFHDAVGVYMCTSGYRCSTK